MSEKGGWFKSRWGISVFNKIGCAEQQNGRIPDFRRMNKILVISPAVANYRTESKKASQGINPIVYENMQLDIIYYI